MRLLLVMVLVLRMLNVGVGRNVVRPLLFGLAGLELL
jgi:hypothetical protein